MRVDRAGRCRVIINEPALTMGLCPQPEILNALAKSKRFRGRGLLARFLYAVPVSRMGFRSSKPDPIPKAVINDYETNIRALIDIPMPKDVDGRIQSHILRLSPEAHAEYLFYCDELEPELGEDGKFENIRDWAAKSAGAAVRIAGLIHCMKYTQTPWEVLVEADTMSEALNLIAVLTNHAMNVFAMMGSDKELTAAKKVWRWIERQGVTEISANKVFQGLKGSFSNNAEFTPVLNILVDRDYLIEKPRPVNQKPGRPSRDFIINPRAMDQ
jgi:hypothetical protein